MRNPNRTARTFSVPKLYCVQMPQCLFHCGQRAREYKDAGNVLSSKQEWLKAKEQWCFGVKLLSGSIPEIRTDYQELMDSLQGNIVLAELKLRRFSEVVELASMILEPNPTNIKMLYRLAMGYIGLENLYSPRQDLSYTMKADPTNRDAKRRLAEVVRKLWPIGAATTKEEIWRANQHAIRTSVTMAKSQGFFDDSVAANAMFFIKKPLGFPETKPILQGITEKVQELSTQIQLHEKVLATEMQNLKIAEANITQRRLKYEKEKGHCYAETDAAKEEMVKYKAECGQLQRIATSDVKYDCNTPKTSS